MGVGFVPPIWVYVLWNSLHHRRSSVYLETYVRVATGVRQGDAIVYFEHFELILHSFDFTLSNINFNYVYSF